MDEKERQKRLYALDKHTYDMTKKLAPVIGGLVLMLRSHISDIEYNAISSTSNPMEKVEKLIESVKTRLEIFDEFCSALKEMKHHNLAKVLYGKHNY